jgi:hypothetical protein
MRLLRLSISRTLGGHASGSCLMAMQQSRTLAVPRPRWTTSRRRARASLRFRFRGVGGTPDRRSPSRPLFRQRLIGPHLVRCRLEARNPKRRYWTTRVDNTQARQAWQRAIVSLPRRGAVVAPRA